MKLVQITDIHLTKPGNTIDGRDPIANFQKALEHALEHHSDAEAIFITGDLSETGEAGDYKRLRAMIDGVSVPIHLMLGNHDDRASFLAEFPECAGDSGFVQHVVELSQGHAITLDTWGPDSHAGFFCQERQDWLAAQLDALPGPVWIFMHHNPVPIEIGPMDQIMLLDVDRFSAAIKPHAENIAHIFHGHCHIVMSGSFHGIPFSAPRGTNHAGWPDFSADLHMSSDQLEAYSVIFTRPDSTFVHLVEFGYQGEIRREY